MGWGVGVKGKLEREGMCVDLRLTPGGVQQNPTQYWKPVILRFKKKTYLPGLSCRMKFSRCKGAWHIVRAQ